MTNLVKQKQNIPRATKWGIEGIRRKEAWIIRTCCAKIIIKPWL